MALKLQIWSLDLIFAIVIFGFTISVVGIVWLHISNGTSTAYGNAQGTAYMQAGAMADTLLSPGFPTDWQAAVNTTNSLDWKGLVPGIMAGRNRLSPAKIYALMSMASTNYTAMKPIFGIGEDYYIVIGSPGPGVANITIGMNPITHNASTILVERRSASLGGSMVPVEVMLWSNTTTGAG